MWLRHHFQDQKVKGQGHQAGLLTAAFTQRQPRTSSVVQGWSTVNRITDMLGDVKDTHTQWNMETGTASFTCALTYKLKALCGCSSHHLQGAGAYCGGRTTGHITCFYRATSAVFAVGRCPSVRPYLCPCVLHVGGLCSLWISGQVVF